MFPSKVIQEILRWHIFFYIFIRLGIGKCYYVLCTGADERFLFSSLGELGYCFIKFVLIVLHLIKEHSVCIGVAGVVVSAKQHPLNSMNITNFDYFISSCPPCELGAYLTASIWGCWLTDNIYGVFWNNEASIDPVSSFDHMCTLPGGLRVWSFDVLSKCIHTIMYVRLKSDVLHEMYITQCTAWKMYHIMCVCCDLIGSLCFVQDFVLYRYSSWLYWVLWIMLRNLFWQQYATFIVLMVSVWSLELTVCYKTNWFYLYMHEQVDVSFWRLYPHHNLALSTHCCGSACLL